MAVDETLPRQEFLDRQRVALAGFLEREDAGAHCGHDLGLATDDPPLRLGRRQAFERDSGSDINEPIVAVVTHRRLGSVAHGYGWLVLHAREHTGCPFKKTLRDMVNTLKKLQKMHATLVKILTTIARYSCGFVISRSGC